MANNPDKNPANGVQGTSYLYDYGTSPNTRTAVSQKVRILTPVYGENTSLHQMGVLSSFNPSQSRTVEPVRGIGFGDQVAELVPSVTEPTTGDFERALLYLCNLWQATGYSAGVDGPVRSLAHHKWPFDICHAFYLRGICQFGIAALTTAAAARARARAKAKAGTRAMATAPARAMARAKATTTIP